MTTLHQCGRIWHDAVFDPEGDGMVAATTGMLLLASVASIICVFKMTSIPVGLGYGAGVPLSMLGVFAWFRFMMGVASQNSPANACLVPSLNRRVRLTAALAWCVTMVPFAAVGYATPDGMVFVLAASVALISIALYCAGRTMFAVGAAAAFWIMLFGEGTLFMAGSPHRTLVLPGLLVLSLCFGAYALRAAFPAGGKRHWEMLDNFAEIRNLNVFSISGQWQQAGKRRRVHALIFRRDVAAPELRRHLLLHVLGPDSNRLAFALPFMLCLLVLIVAKPVADSFNFPSFFKGTVYGMASMALISTWVRHYQGMWVTGTEQSLVKLAPGMPAAPLLNRELARQILQACLRDWAAFGIVGLVGITVWTGETSHYQVLVALLGATLIGVSLSLGDYSSKSGFPIAMLVVGLSINLLVFILSLFYTKDLVVWSCLVAAMLLQSICVIRMRWQSMASAPVAFPAGRMA